MTRDALVCQHAEANCLHPLECEPIGLPSTYVPSLTEVACLAIYGSSLKPGHGDGSLFQRFQSEEQVLRRLWRSGDGLEWLKHVQLTGSSAIAATGDPQNLLAFVKRWHAERRLIVVETLPQKNRAIAKLLKACSDEEAMRLAAEAAVEGCSAAAKVVNAFRIFYRIASELITCNKIILAGLPERGPGDLLPAANGGPHREIPLSEYRLGLGHDLVNNSIAYHVPYDANLWADAIFDRERRRPENGFLTWTDIRIEHKMANVLLAEYRRRSVSVRTPVEPLTARNRAPRSRQTVASRRRGRPPHSVLEQIKPSLMAKLEHLGEPRHDVDKIEKWSNKTDVWDWVTEEARKVVASEDREPGHTTIKDFVRGCLEEFRRSKQQ